VNGTVSGAGTDSVTPQELLAAADQLLTSPVPGAGAQPLTVPSLVHATIKRADGMSTRVEVNPELLAWARQRSGVPLGDLARRFPMLTSWEQGEQRPTLKQLESFAQVTHTPFGFLFLPEPPVERVPIPDYRTIGDTAVRDPSADLLDTIYQCQQRQDWYRDFAIVNHEQQVELVGSLTTATPVVNAANSMRTALDFDVEHRGFSRSDALRILIEHAERLGFLVMVNGVVGSNTHRKLNPREFRGFALADQMAPLAFVNGADTKAAQIFTLLHELAHLWLGGTALDDADLTTGLGQDAEQWCNQVAAEVLLPLAAVADALVPGEALADAVERFARRFKVSTLVVLRRLYDAGSLGWSEYRSSYDAELRKIIGLLGERASGGGNFYNTQPTRFGRRFTRAVITNTLEGQTLYRDALQLLGFKKMSTFNELASHLGIG
jgi:Zn-dependent peptidase ImmA (M78 family)